MTVNINQDVFWLDVSVNNIQTMNVFQTFDKFSKIKLGLAFGKLLNLAEMEKHLTTCADVHHKKELFFALETPVQTNHKRMD
jgi:hypothetical protein